MATLSNYLSTPVTVTSLTMPAQFSIVSGAQTTCINGAVLPAAAADGTPTTCTVAVQFSPNAQNLFFGFNTAWGQTATFNLTGTTAVPTIALSGTALNNAIAGSGAFGNQEVGSTSAAHVFTFTNSGGAPVTLTSVTFGGANPTSYAVASNTCTGAGTSAIAVGATCQVGVTFTPTATGSRPATLSIGSATGSQSVNLTGTGIARATTSLGSLAFGNVTRGQVSTTQLVTLSNPAGNPNMTGTSIAFGGANPTNFRRSTTTPGTCGTGATFTVNAGASCTIGVVFAPPTGGTAGARAGTLTISTTSTVLPPTPAITLGGTAQ